MLTVYSFILHNNVIVAIDTHSRHFNNPVTQNERTGDIDRLQQEL